MKLDANIEISQALTDAAAEGVKVELRLTNGQTIAGRVGSVTESALVIEEISGKEYFDAYVRLDHVTAFEIRARG